MAEMLPVYTGKKGPRTYKAAKGSVGRGHFGNLGQKPAKKARISSVDKKVKQVSNKVMKSHTRNPGPAAHNRY